LKLAALDCRDDFGYRSRAEHYVDAKPSAHALTLRKLRQTTDQTDRQVFALTLFLAQLAEQGLNLFHRLASHGAAVDKHEIGFPEAVNERIPDTRKLRLDGVGVVLVHLTPECDYMCSH
jgi:hypothetical protein